MTPIAPLSASMPPPQPQPDGKLREAAEAFEAIILRQMLATMRQARLADDPFGSGATDNFRELADARLADSIAARRQFGIADMVEQQLSGQSGVKP